MQVPQRSLKLLSFLLLILAIALPGLSAQTIPPTYFGLHMSSGVTYGTPWPSVGFGGIRLLDSQTSWAQLNPAAGVYDWTMLDRWLSVAEAHGLGGNDLIFTFTSVPTWASSKPRDTSCAHGPGSCDPPDDLNADGTGSNQHWKDFVNALAIHVRGRIGYWEVWNEPYWKPYFTGTPAQIVRLAQDLHAIVQATDPNAKVLSPAGSDMHVSLSNPCWAAKNMNQYFAAGIGSYIDIVNFHAYYAAKNGPNRPENFISEVQCIRSMMANYGQQNKPLWASEGGWAHMSDLPDPDDEAAFVGRAYLLLWSQGVSRFYWYRWSNSHSGTLWDRSNGLLKPGIAYGNVYDWLVGATMITDCAQQASQIWTCFFTLSSGAPAEAVWSLSPTNYTPANYFSKYRTLSGSTVTIPNGVQVPIGPKPILLE